MDALMRVGAVEKLDDGTLRLLSKTYIPHTSDASKIAIMGRDVSDLISTIDHNLSCKPEQTFFHRNVFSNNLPDEALDRVRTETARHAQALLDIENSLLAKHDRDATGHDSRLAGPGGPSDTHSQCLIVAHECVRSRSGKATQLAMPTPI